MNYKKLGNTDLDVSTICLGTMTWGEQNSEKEGFEQMDFALSQGVNFWDTAEIYSIPMREETYGETEKIIGNWFQKTKKRNDVVLATKVCGNFFKQNRKMKKSWYDGTTGLPPLDYAIKNALNFGWSHHIERLMILSNIMNLCEIKPIIVYKWFMEMFVDSSDWVMVPNVYGMGLFSDGGIFATKPYICGSAYFMKMMDFKKGEWCNTMDGLYWRFIDRNRKFFLTNPRLSMMVRIFDKMKTDRKKLILSEADKFIKQNTI